MYSFLQPPMCLAKALVLDGSDDACKRAQALLSKLENHLGRIHNTRFLIETLALRAMLSNKIGDAALAVEQLERAVSLAQTGGFIRLFVDLGPDIAPLLNRLELKGEKLEYVGRILAAFRAERGQADEAHPAPTPGISIKGIAGLPEPLSHREQEVLMLLAGRLSNKEIGDRLYISTHTVKRHAHSIYEKLNVKGRREAVTKALGLGLITD
jgi:LuxR family maltose regulon positive regulatory protein